MLIRHAILAHQILRPPLNRIFQRRISFAINDRPNVQVGVLGSAIFHQFDPIPRSFASAAASFASTCGVCRVSEKAPFK